MATLIDITGYTLDTLEVDFPESAARSAIIFGNGYHSVPVRVKFRLLDKDKKNVSADFLKYVYLYDIKSNKGFNRRFHEPLNTGALTSLYAEDSRNDYTLGLYDNKSSGMSEMQADVLLPQDSNAPAELLFYVHTPLNGQVPNPQTFQLGAYLTLKQEATPAPEQTSSGNGKSVNLEVRAPLNYGDAGQWALLDNGVSAPVAPGSMDLTDLDAGNVTFMSTRFSLQHSALKDSPLRLSVLPSSGQAPNFMAIRSDKGLESMAGAVFTGSDTSTGKRKATVENWFVPEAGARYTLITAKSSSDSNQRVALKNPAPLFNAGAEVNHVSPVLTIMQASLVIRDEKFGVQGGTHNTGVVSIRDNIGHVQNIEISCDTGTGKPSVTGKA